MYIKTENLDTALIAVCQALSRNGIEVQRRNFKCLEIPSAVIIEITNPTNRYVHIPERKWNKTLGWVESLWIASGDNHLEMPAASVKNLKNFSDDGLHMRAGYGPRIRRFGDNYEAMNYNFIDYTFYRQYKGAGIGASQEKTDQLRFVIEKFNEDINTREAVISIADPVADDFDAQAAKINGKSGLLVTKDTPCTRSIHFMVVNGKMNCYVDMRSNDVIWGFSAVNVFNFTLMQEYVAAMVGVPVGSYFHKVDNLHVYEDFWPLVKQIAQLDVESFATHLEFTYPNTHFSLDEFDANIQALLKFEKSCREGIITSKEEALIHLTSSLNPLFLDWGRVFLRYWLKEPVEFYNPLLNDLFR